MVVRDEYHRFGYFLDEGLTDTLFICLERWTRRAEDSRPTLSYDLRSEAEIDDAINILIRDLDIARRDATRKLLLKLAIDEIRIKIRHAWRFD